MKLNLVKWRLMLATLPVTLSVVMVKVILLRVLHFEGWFDYSDITLIITGGIFLAGFMLAGTLSDYKESERLPALMAGTLESIEDTLDVAHVFKGNFDLQAQKKKLFEVTESIIRYFAHQETEADVYRQIEGLTAVAIHVERTGMGSTTSWVKREQANLRQFFSRTTVIKRTAFISTGYAFLEALTVVIILVLLVCRFESFALSILLVSFLTHIFTYMIYLIRDIDHPFEYPASGRIRAADIDLFPLTEYRDRAAARMSS